MIEQLLGAAVSRTAPRTATSIIRSASFPATASSPASRSTSCAPASASRSTQAKHDPLDFVLWKHAKPGEPCVGVAVGRGPPGLAHRVLGDVAARCSASTSTSTAAARTCSFRTTRTRSRSREGAHGETFVNYWMHNGFVRVDDEKMSKSLGNFFTVREVLARYDAEVVRFFIAARALPQPAQLFRPASRRRAPGADAACTPH